MKKKLLNSLRVLLVAAGLLMGANAWADEAILSINLGTDGAEATASNSITGASGSAAEGVTIAITGNNTKNWTAGNGNITYSGTSYKTLKNSNGAQNTITLPAGKVATKVTFYAVINSGTTNATLNEVDGIACSDEITSQQDYANPTVIEKTISRKNSFTFTFGSAQTCFIAVVTYRDEWITETYTFSSMSNVTFVQSSTSFTTADNKTVCLPTNAPALKDRFAFDNAQNTWGAAWQIRSGAGGLQCLSTTGYFSVVGLMAGDVVKFTIDTSYDPNITFRSSNARNGEIPVTAGTTVIENDVEYTITETGNLDLHWGNKKSSYSDISQIIIKTTQPSLTRTAITKTEDGLSTKLTVTPGTIRGDGTGTIITKYSFTSSEAAKTGTLYEGALYPEVDGTLYAYSYVDTEERSFDVVSLPYEVKEWVKTKVIDFTALGHEGLASGSGWSTTLHGSKKSYPTWTIYNTDFIPELTYGSDKIQIVSNYNYIGLRQEASSTITIDDLADNQVVKLIRWDEEAEVSQSGSSGKAMTISNWFISRRLEYYTPAEETVELSVGEAGLATYMGSYTIDLTGDTKIAAYKATVDGSTVTLTKVTIVPAGEAVLLRSLEGGAANTTVPVAAYSAWAAADNAFVGAYREKVVNLTDGDYTNFVLSNEGGVVGFFKAKTEANGGTTVGAGKAYLPVLTSGLSEARQMKLVFGDKVAGVNFIYNPMSTEGNKYFSISGQRIDKPTKGLYIVNGKKVIIK